MKNMTTFPKRLLELRKQHNLTQRDVASYLSIAQPSYIRYETARQSRRLTTFRALPTFLTCLPIILSDGRIIDTTIL